MIQTETLAPPPTHPSPSPLRWWRRLHEETLGGAIFAPRPFLANVLLALLPEGTLSVLRTGVYRHVWGIRVGSGAVIMGRLAFASAHLAAQNVQIGSRAVLNARVFIDAAAPVNIGDGASIGHDALLITTDHAIGLPEFRAAERFEKPVTVGAGAWIAAGAKILPGRTVGAGAVVAAGAVVTKDVAENTLVAGVPARKVRDL
ncbi:MAG: acyltransferase [Armatimonadetes bacterium]|nr:acyltransferase [Armatimonadota bacterium]